ISLTKIKQTKLDLLNKEWREKNKEHDKIRFKIYGRTNKEKIAQRSKKYRLN
mgnify:CR=1